MSTFKRYLAVFVGLLFAGAAVAFHVTYAWPEGLNALSQSDRDLMMFEPVLETCAVFFIVLRRSSSFVAIRLGAIGPTEELIQDTLGNIRMTEIMASLVVILFRGLFRIHPGAITLADYFMMTFAIVNFSINISEGVIRRKHKKGKEQSASR
jgi:hypothetical protein